MVVDLVPVAHRQVRFDPWPCQASDPMKKVASKGKAIPHPTTQPHMCKVTQITSPMLE